MAYAPEWLKAEQREQIMRFLDSIGNSPHFEDYEEPLMEVIHFGNDPEHQYDPDIIRQYVKVTENYDKFRGHNVLDVSPEFARLKKDL